MQFTFEGNYKPKRNINLGGVRSHEDKKTLLAKAQAERRARERERLRNRSAVLIQSFYREKREAGILRQQLRAELEQNIFELPSLLQDPDRHEAAIQRTVLCIRQIILIYRCAQPTDVKFVYELCSILVASFQNVPLCMAPFMREYRDDPESWMWLLVLIANRVLLPAISKGSSTFITPAATMLSIITDETNYQQITIMNPSFPARDIYIQIITQCIVNGKLLECISSALRDEHNTSFQEPINQIVAILNNIAQCQQPYHYPPPAILSHRKPSAPRPSFSLFSQANESTLETVYQPPELSKKLIWKQFVTQIFTVPFMTDRVPDSSLIKLLSNLPFSGALKELASVYDTGTATLSDEETASLLMNFTEIGNVRSAAYIEDSLENYAEAIQLLLTHLPTAYLGDATRDEANAMQIDDEDESDYTDDDDSKEQVPTISDQKADPRIKERLQKLYDTEHITSLVRRFMQHMSTIIASDASHQDVMHLIAVMAGLFNSLMIRWVTRRDVMLNILLYHRWVSDLHIIHLLWQAWKMSDIAAAFSGDVMDNLSTAVKCIVDTDNPDIWCILYLLCELYMRLLLTIGDDEFFDKKNTNKQLSLSDIVTFSNHLKNISFVLYWKASSIDLENSIGMTGIKLSQLRNTVTHLVQLIHARDARRSFCPKDHWLVKDLDNENFSRQVAAEELELENEPERRQPSKGRLAIISPRLGVLNNIPFVIPFEQRVEIFRMFVANDRQDDFIRPQMGVAIRRTHVFEDGFTHLYPLGAQLKHRIPISFVDEFGLQEAGIDGGGVFKEFLTSLSHEAFDTNYGLFLATPDQLLYPNPNEYATDATQLAFYEFLGLIIGKALYEGILLDVAFAEFFLKKCLGGINYLDDLPSLDPELYKGLIAVKNFQGNVEDLSLDFTLSQDDLGPSRTVELIPGGKDIPVTNENKIRYVYLVANYRLNVQIARQCKAFFRGLSTIIDIKWLRMFNQHELQVLLGGAQVPIDINDLRRHTLYAGYTEQDPTIQNFWQVLQELDNEQRQKFVKFVTSCSRPPLLGFKALHPQICIRNAGPDDDRLPTSSTCINLLKLPQFSSKDILKRKLVYAINAEAGFDLS